MVTKGGGVLLLVLGAMSTGVVGCGKVHRTFNAKTDGVLIQSDAKSQSEVQDLFPGNKVTVINQEANIYKIQNVALKDVNERLPSAYAEEDLVINLKNPGLDVSQRDSLSTRASIQKTIAKLNCVKSPSGPTANLDLTNQPDLVAPNTVEVDSGDLVFTAEKSEGGKAPTGFLENIKDVFKNPFGSAVSETAKSSLAVHWVVEAPQGSKTLQEADTMKLTVTPDRPGGYTVAVIVQDASGACDLTGVTVGATQNKKFVKSSAGKGTYSAQKFFQVPLVNAEKAWEVSQGEGVTIAIVDSGVNYNHPDLNENIKMNKDEIPNNGVDDDNNGYIDDVYGWDFAIGDAYPYDDESHGTHVAGLAASSVSGIAKKAKILPVKAMLPSGMGTISSLVSAIYYAIGQKADIINLSLGGEGKASPLLLAAVKKAQSAGILIVAAAGNGDEQGHGINTDVVPSNLTAFDGSNILAVAASDESDELTDYSNYGKKSINVAAPGGTREHPLMSTYSQTDLAKYIGYEGTSMATPVAAGVAALVKAVNPSLTAEELKAVLTGSVKESSSLSGKLSSGGVLDAYSAVTNAQHLLSPLAAN
jgi:subtilisin family serine protease